jgi:uncharacterized membrane protein YkgB
MMTDYFEKFDKIDKAITYQMTRWGIPILRIALGIVFFWFGALKMFLGVSPAEPLISATVTILPIGIFMPILATWEMAIGIGFLTGKFLRTTILLLFLQMPGTMSPIFLLPERVFTDFPFGLTLEGQYIFKNLVLISSAIVIGSTVRNRRFKLLRKFKM